MRLSELKRLLQEESDDAEVYIDDDDSSAWCEPYATEVSEVTRADRKDRMRTVVLIKTRMYADGETT